MTLTKAMMAEQLFQKMGLNRREARALVNAYFELMCQALEQGEPVKLSGFGNFSLRQKKQRPGRNPKTGKEATISARCVVTFRPGRKLKAKIESHAGNRA